MLRVGSRSPVRAAHRLAPLASAPAESSCGYVCGVEDVGGEFVVEFPDDAHGVVAGVAEVGGWAGVEVGGAPRSPSASLVSRKKRWTEEPCSRWWMYR